MKKISKIVFLCVLPRILSSKDVAIIAAHLVFAWSPSGCLLVSELKEKKMLIMYLILLSVFYCSVAKLTDGL